MDKPNLLIHIHPSNWVMPVISGLWIGYCNPLITRINHFWWDHQAVLDRDLAAELERRSTQRDDHYET